MPARLLTAWFLFAFAALLIPGSVSAQGQEGESICGESPDTALVVIGKPTSGNGRWVGYGPALDDVRYMGHGTEIDAVAELIYHAADPYYIAEALELNEPPPDGTRKWIKDSVLPQLRRCRASYNWIREPDFTDEWRTGLVYVLPYKLQAGDIDRRRRMRGGEGKSLPAPNSPW